MKTLFVTLLSLPIMVSAAPVLGPPVTQCSAIPGVSGTANDLIFAFATWTTAGFACEQQDKIYSNFSPGAIPTGTTLRLQVQPLVTGDFHTATFNGNFLTSFTVSYDIAIDLTLNPTELITAVTGDISNPSNTGTPSNLKSIFSEGGALIGTLTSTPGSPGTTITTANTALHAVDAYTAGGGAAVSISNTFRESPTVPEPASFVMLGSAVIGLSLLMRAKRSTK